MATLWESRVGVGLQGYPWGGMHVQSGDNQLQTIYIPVVLHHLLFSTLNIMLADSSPPYWRANLFEATCRGVGLIDIVYYAHAYKVARRLDNFCGYAQRYTKRWSRYFFRSLSSALFGDMAEGAGGEQHVGSVDTERDLLIQQEQRPGSRGISSRGSSGEAASLSLAATAAPAPGDKNLGYYSENGYLLELPRQERQRVRQEIKRRFKPGEP